MPIDYSQFAIPKPSSRYRAKQAKRAEEAKEYRDCCHVVDQRDGFACRVCKRACGGIGMLERAHHHHVNYRSLGGQHTTDNVIRICADCHAAIHDAKLRVEGDADQRDPLTHRTNGIAVYLPTESGWKLDRWV